MAANESKTGKSGMAKKLLLWLVPLLTLILFTSSGCLLLPIGRHKYDKAHALAKFEEAVSELYPPGDNVPVDLVVPPEIGSPSSTEFHSYCTSMIIFESKAYTLLCGYDEAEYTEAKAAIEARYSFRTEPLYSEDTTFSDDAKQLEPVFDIGDDHFRFIMPNDEYDGYCGEFFKGCFIVVTNDAEHEIAYIAFMDQDLDVADDLAEFVKDTCGWKYVR